MKALLCDICGGKIVIKSGGIAICENCGMEHSAERMKEKIQEIQESTKLACISTEPEQFKSIQVDNHKLVDNYLEMAECACADENYVEAEALCDKALEIDSTQYRVWFMKGKAIAWQSTLSEPRLKGSMSAFIKAITKASDEEKENIVDEATKEIFGVFSILLHMKSEEFIEHVDRKTVSEIRTLIKDQYYDIYYAFERADIVIIALTDYLLITALIVARNVTKAYNTTILANYQTDTSNGFYSGEDKLCQYVSSIDYCVDLLEMAANICIAASKEEQQVTIYKQIISLYKDAIESCLYVRKIDEKSGDITCEELSLSEEAKDIRRKKINEYKEKIKRIELSIEQKQEEEAKARFNAYWSEHADEKRALEQEKESLEIQVKNLLDEIEGLPGNAEKLQLQAHLKCLIIEQKSLGLFEIKKRHSIQEQIDKAYFELNELKAQMAPGKGLIESRIKPLEDRLAEIMHELTRNR